MQVYVYNAFSHGPFSGNPAAVVPYRTTDGLDAALMQAIAEQHNLAETAFVRLDGLADGAFALRWFTPAQEVRLCGHATLASAAVLRDTLDGGRDRAAFAFETLSGRLTCRRDDAAWLMDFPADEPQAPPPAVAEAVAQVLGHAPAPDTLFVGGDDAMLVLPSAREVRAFAKTEAIRAIPKRGLIVTGPGADGEASDVVSRCFYPEYGIDEDAATGSAHTLLGVYWSRRLGRERLRCQQASRRVGVLDVRYGGGSRIEIGGATDAYLTGTIRVPGR